MLYEVNGFLCCDQEILDKELAFDGAGGFTEVDDRMPGLTTYEALRPTT